MKFMQEMLMELLLFDMLEILINLQYINQLQFISKFMIQRLQNQNGFIQRKHYQLHQRIKELKFGIYHNLERSKIMKKKIFFYQLFKNEEENLQLELKIQINMEKGKMKKMK
ncbi:unnamed protein product [Paramecium pentaurelia]|uniref:Uncharacterized protein n=1 Tax=Paramecium pentaurelia TaxID=43138 RepID=A0A8S1VWZ3_9CILI|nr:unnamed protein product [Paramecium pentaurelia]